MHSYSIIDFKAVILDFDGTLVPSECVFLQAWKRVFRDKFHCVFSDEEYIKYELENDTELIDFLIQNNRLNCLMTKQEYMNYVYEEYEHDFRAMLRDVNFDEVLNHIKEWTNYGIKVSIASTSKRKYIDLFFDRYKKYRQIFEYIICREDVDRLKPDPMIYNLSAQKMSIANSKCIAVEDSHKGIIAALSAGMQVISVSENSLSCYDFSEDNVIKLNSIMDIVL